MDNRQTKQCSVLSLASVLTGRLLTGRTGRREGMSLNTTPPAEVPSQVSPVTANIVSDIAIHLREEHLRHLMDFVLTQAFPSRL